ncbi:DUF4837 family protein [Xanthomarina sp. F2636L]|uniref:DUF4837 family protein n=1 Tax=Xanthomarina sp. F2636L TaxID=2996018 RepID=UPI00225DEF37|nr:DUF4837 family protein [Xanthomarina sp. F2636L]MCX7551312.1 DUF4837 family protein [Xanthomarina sp. F2636L]
MKQTLFLFSLLFVISCGKKNSSNQKILSNSSGNINNLSVVIENDLWEGNIGEAIRDVLAAPVDGLPQDEPLFNMSQIPPAVFTGFVTKNRTVFKVEKGGEASIKIASDVYAKPQKLVLITGKTDSEIIQQIEENKQKIVTAFKTEEVKEKQRRIKLSLHSNESLKEKLGITLNFPTAYRIAKEEDKFFWIRKDITTGTTNLMIFELPYNAIKKDDSLVDQIIKLRDSIGKAHIPGPTEGTYMITEEAYAPAVFETIIDNKQAIETKGLWDVKDAFMSGPFINYIIDDKINNRLLVIEGFAFAPSVEKRDYMFELEAIIRSLKIED